jgi:diguanylate cyclase (GGDEF)-like protein
LRIWNSPHPVGAGPAVGGRAPEPLEHDRREVARDSVDPGYWPRSTLLRVLIAVSYCALVPAGLLPMSVAWWLISGGTLLLYSVAAFLIFARFGVSRLHTEITPYIDTLVVTLAIVALADPPVPIWMGYVLAIPALAQFHSTRYMLLYSLWSIAAFWSGLVILHATGRAELSWQMPIVVSIMTAFAAMNADIIADSNRRLREMVTRASVTDPLTGLANRRLFQRVLASHAQGDTRPLAVLMYDVDDFKALNETYGHVHADGVLVRIAEELRQSFPDADAVARYGGDELIVLQHVASLADAVSLGERSIARVREVAGIGISVGLGVYPLTARSLEAVLRQADAALGSAKRAGKAQLAAAA